MRPVTEHIVVPAKRRAVQWESYPAGQEKLIRCETPTLTGGVPTDWVDAYLEDPDSFGVIGERDTEGAAVLAEAAGLIIPMSSAVLDEGIADFELDEQLEDRLDTNDHAVVFVENTR